MDLGSVKVMVTALSILHLSRRGTAWFGGLEIRGITCTCRYSGTVLVTVGFSFFCCNSKDSCEMKYVFTMKAE